MNKKLKNNGITLISLVITIIIMLILVGVSINLAVNGGLFEYAGNAVGETKNAMKNEQGLIDDIIENYIKPNTKKDEGILTAPTLAVTSGTEGNNGWYTSNVIVKITPQSGATKTTYSVSGAQTVEETEITGETNIEITAEGVSTITAYTYNNSGKKSEPVTKTINKDSIAPTFNFEIPGVGMTWVDWKVTSISDTNSGIPDDVTIKIFYKLVSDSNYKQYSSGSEKEGVIDDLTEYSSYYIKAEIEDMAGNIGKVEKTAGTNCFVAGTKVLTESGLKNIEEIQVGEKVYALNTDNNQKELKEVIALFKGYSNEIYEITVGNTVIKATPKHQFYIVDKGWIRAHELEISDELVAKGTSEKIIISNIKHIFCTEPVTVYNLTVEDYHNYLITEYNLLVHNAGSDDN